MYGKTFPLELKAAGLADLPFAWCADGSFLFDETLTPEQIAAIEAVAAAHDPNAAPTPIDLLNKLDADNALTQRNLRETIMLMNEAFKTVSGGALDLSLIPGVAQVYSVEAQAQTLRGML